MYCYKKPLRTVAAAYFTLHVVVNEDEALVARFNLTSTYTVSTIAAIVVRQHTATVFLIVSTSSLT
jgi:hypothetical protein